MFYVRRAKSKAKRRKEPTTMLVTRPCACDWMAYDHQALVMGSGSTTIVFASVDGRNVTSLPALGADGNTQLMLWRHDCLHLNISIPAAPGWKQTALKGSWRPLILIADLWDAAWSNEMLRPHRRRANLFASSTTLRGERSSCGIRSLLLLSASLMRAWVRGTHIGQHVTLC